MCVLAALAELRLGVLTARRRYPQRCVACECCGIAMHGYRAACVRQLHKRSGYSTLLVGKWHLGYESVDDLPLAKGFDDFFGFLNAAEDHYSAGARAPCGELLWEGDVSDVE